ncbi:GDSL-type esterase/lipase family protein [Mycolicibacterium wolinskyi]|uniref:GDSL-type esterase/lipase family protein n=1 Tax=Mycolicibacterium wolinskyi TaxID=59750 RepID=UPI00391788EC
MPDQFIVTGDLRGLVNGSKISGLGHITSNVRAIAVSDSTVGYIPDRGEFKIVNGILQQKDSAQPIVLTSASPDLGIDGELQYTFTFRIQGLDLPAVTITAPADDTPVNLVANMPVTPVGATPITRGPQGVQGAPGPATTLLGPRVVFHGDSVTANGIGTDTAGNQDRARSWTTEFVALSMGRLNYVRNAAVAGHRSDQLLAAFDTAVAPYAPNWVLLSVGVNDVLQGIEMSVWLANLDAYLTKCRAIGAELVVGAVWPIADTPQHITTVLAWNAALYAWGAANGVTIVPWDRLADPTTGGWPASWTADGIHPTLADSYSQIGAFGWDFLAPKVGPGPAVRRAVSNSESALTNGFFTTKTAVLGVPHTLSATPATTAGSLGAGTYSYKVTSRGNYGESLPATIADAVLSATGQITVAATAASGSRGVNIYRKGPGDTDWKFVRYQANGTGSWVDDGTVTPGAPMTGVDTSQGPAGLLRNSSTALHAIDGQSVFAEPGIRGNVVRLRSSGIVDGDYVAINVTPGQKVSFSCLLRAPGQRIGDRRAAVALRHQRQRHTGQPALPVPPDRHRWPLATRAHRRRDRACRCRQCARVMGIRRHHPELHRHR